MKVKGTCEVKKWDEKDFCELQDSMKITKADIEYAIYGDIGGKAVVIYTMFYNGYDKSNPHNSSAEYVGLIHFTGKIAGKSGSFVLEDRGSFKSGVVSSSVKIVENSGTSELKNITGVGNYSAGQNGFTMELDCNV